MATSMFQATALNPTVPKKIRQLNAIFEDTKGWLHQQLENQVAANGGDADYGLVCPPGLSRETIRHAKELALQKQWDVEVQAQHICMLVSDVLSERKLDNEVNTIVEANRKAKEERVIAKLIYDDKLRRRVDALEGSKFEAPNYMPRSCNPDHTTGFERVFPPNRRAAFDAKIIVDNLDELAKHKCVKFWRITKGTEKYLHVVLNLEKVPFEVKSLKVEINELPLRILGVRVYDAVNCYLGSNRGAASDAFSRQFLSFTNRGGRESEGLSDDPGAVQLPSSVTSAPDSVHDSDYPILDYLPEEPQPFLPTIPDSLVNTNRFLQPPTSDRFPWMSTIMQPQAAPPAASVPQTSTGSLTRAKSIVNRARLLRTDTGESSACDMPALQEPSTTKTPKKMKVKGKGSATSTASAGSAGSGPTPGPSTSTGSTAAKRKGDTSDGGKGTKRRALRRKTKKEPSPELTDDDGNGDDHSSRANDDTRSEIPSDEEEDKK